ncbi:TonB family protein [Tardiphaga alba]|uniref:TonB family protein n=1 Tax=Tardiphaga alba TaxID=340268 RepID=A0ABX8A471_9BRAD|nr:energy transducer TonB [Tardiphaga alba]QUS38446.1 TonB family protein [Tardiphaga alba]
MAETQPATFDRYGHEPNKAPAFDFHDEADTGMSATGRLLIGSTVIVPVLVAVGVYWLHQLPVGPALKTGNSTIQVELIPAPVPATEFKQAALQQSPPIADFQVEPKIVEQSLAPVEQETAPQPQPAPSPRPAAVPEQKPAGGGQSRPMPVGTASRFQRVLLTHIERYQSYPATARRDGHEDTVFVVFAMRRDGTVARVEIKSSSGQPILDQAAIETIRRAQPLPKIPADMPDILTVSVPVTFRAR